ncbi:hypothetical protein HK098_007921 [Nowakowskiella sp. JEL0407]|nr:hypothetical protein HK098_007921 [Nowakowskiella sp. JEL0407]
MEKCPDKSVTNKEMIIIGGGIAGLVLALGLKKRLGLDVAVYEQAQAYGDGVGGAIGMYANGLRVIKDISPETLSRIRESGKPYVYRRWMRHDGSEIAVGTEKSLAKFESDEEAEELASIGIRRWKIQRILYESCVEAGIEVVMGKRVAKIDSSGADGGIVKVSFVDGETIETDYGVKSVTRNSLFSQTDPEYTGMTCLMGVAPIPSSKEGIRFPSSITTKCHCCFYPTAENETIFQLYFPEVEKPETWKVLSEEEGLAECDVLANRFREDGWDKQFIEPLEKATNVIRVGLRARNPIPRWRDEHNRIILLGDAAHPPVPYIGQGAMMAIEDVGILLALMEELAMTKADDESAPQVRSESMETVLRLYEALRIPRTTEMLANSNALGKMQLERATNPSGWEIAWKEWKIWADVMYHGTLPIMWKGAGYNYREAVIKILEEEKISQ